MGAGSGVTGSGLILFHPEQQAVLQMGLGRTGLPPSPPALWDAAVGLC